MLHIPTNGKEGKTTKDRNQSLYDLHWKTKVTSYGTTLRDPPWEKCNCTSFFEALK